VDEPPGPDLYYAATQDLTFNPSFAVRVAGDAESIIPAVRGRLREVDAQLPVAGISELQEVINTTLFRSRFLAALFSLFAVLALVLAGIGIYGVIAFIVAGQVREIGIRRALGATSGQIRNRVVLGGMLPVAVGLVAGLILVAALAGLVGSLLYGVTPTDPVTLGSVVVVTLIAGLVGCLAPALRATRIEPVEALREG
jgi:ABC-type antimicrobial peptide transport system permease subunit